MPLSMVTSRSAIGTVGAGAQHVDVDECEWSADRAFDHAQPAAGQPRVDPQHSHVGVRLSSLSEQVFVRTLTAPGYARDTPRGKGARQRGADGGQGVRRRSDPSVGMAPRSGCNAEHAGARRTRRSAAGSGRSGVPEDRARSLTIGHRDRVVAFVARERITSWASTTGPRGRGRGCRRRRRSGQRTNREEGSGRGGRACTRLRAGPPRPGREAVASSSAITSSETSKLAKTFCTSSKSSRASMRRNTLAALSLSSSTCRSGTNSASAES